MRILVCTDNFYSVIGGAEAAVSGCASALDGAGRGVLSVCPEYGCGARDRLSHIQFDKLGTRSA